MKPVYTILFWFSCCFVVLFIISLPFSYQILPNIGIWISSLGELHFLRTDQQSALNLASDSRYLYRCTLFLLFLALPLSFLCFALDQKGKYALQGQYYFNTFISYYLALSLFIYGFNKIFKHQFYLPEPNILYSPVGSLSKDILYWTTIGASYSYSVFAGILEVIPACLLLFRKTRLLGALLAMAVLINVLMINIGFDISVKLYSTFLLLLSVLIVFPQFSRLYHFFIKEEWFAPKQWTPKLDSQKKVLWYSIAKAFVIGMILSESLWIYFQNNNFNDDKQKRPFLHGAYEVKQIEKNALSLPTLNENKESIKRVFIHRNGYFIIQLESEKMQDYRLTYDLNQKQLILEDHQSEISYLTYHFNKQDSLLSLKGLLNTDSIVVNVKQLDLTKLPLLQDEIHWTLEGHVNSGE